MRKGAIILCGGQSKRMGCDKATLPFGSESLLQRIIRIATEVVAEENIVVVASAQQTLPPLPARVCVVRDPVPDCGPLAGIAAGLRSLASSSDIDTVFVTGCDAPFIVPAFVERIFELLVDCDAAVPSEEGQLHPLAASYRTSVLSQIDELLASGEFRAGALCDRVITRKVSVNELKAADPQLRSLQNLNSEEEYLAALATLGNGPRARI